MKRLKAVCHTSRRVHRRRTGSSLLIVMVILLATSIAIGALLEYTRYQRAENVRHQMYIGELSAAEYAMNVALSTIRFYGFDKPVQVIGGIQNFDNAVLEIPAPALAGYSYPEFTIEGSPANTFEYVEINDPADEWNGYPVLQLSYTVTVLAKATGGNSERLAHPGVKLSRVITARSIPLYVFGIFYNNTLEIWPGPRYEMRGRVHTNGDLYLGAGSRADYFQAVTSAGQVYSGKRHPNSGIVEANSGGRVNIMDRQSPNSMFNLLENGNPIDFEQLGADWMQAALDRWHGGLRDENHGIFPLNLPIPQGTDPHTLIDRADDADPVGIADQKFENQADLRIVRENGSIVGYDGDGNVVPLTYVDSGGNTVPVYNTLNFWDEREGAMLQVLELDIAKLIASGIPIGQGLIYMSEDGVGSIKPAVRIANGSVLPTTTSGGFTLVTDDPLYIKGDFNVGTDRIGAMLAGDAINILSNTFDDALNQTGGTKQVATPTETNAIFVSGNVPSAKNTYSGGAENFFRYNERWTDVKHKFRGSLLNLFASKTALGPWTRANYNPPDRDWGWDDIYLSFTSPPGMLEIFDITTSEWKLMSPYSSGSDG